MRKLLFPLFLFACIIITSNSAKAQQYKLRQSTGVMSMKLETTIYVKGMRKRTESSAMMGVSVPTTIEQCDKQRTIKLNDKKKLYFIEPFAKEEIIDEDIKQAPSKIKPASQPTTTQKGGTIHMWYNITDTGERKKMNGFTARHIWTTQKIKPSADACTMKDSLIIKTDGWYIDLPEFNCPVRFSSSAFSSQKTVKPDCQDKFLTHRSGKGKLGFPLTETRTIIMGNGTGSKNEFKTDLETLEFTSTKLDSMLFEIPPGYTLTTNEEDLQDKMNMKDMMNQYKNNNQNSGNDGAASEEKKPGTSRIGIYAPTGDEQIQGLTIQQSLSSALSGGKIDAVSISNAGEAGTSSCDYTIGTQVTKIKQASKVGGLLKAIKNTDPGATTSFNIEAVITLTKIADGSTQQKTVNGKYEGKVDEAVTKAIEEGSRQLLKGLK